MRRRDVDRPKATRIDKRRVLVVPTEEQEHMAVAGWLDAHGILFHHSPNGGERVRRVDARGRTYCSQMQKFKRMGTKPGFPDFVIFDRPPVPEIPPLKAYRKKFPTLSEIHKEMEATDMAGWECRGGVMIHPNTDKVGVAIELKRIGAPGATLLQKVWIDSLSSRGWLARVCYGAEEAIGWLQGLGYGVRR